MHIVSFISKFAWFASMCTCRKLHGMLSLHFSLNDCNYREFLGVGKEADVEPEEEDMMEEQKTVMAKVYGDDKNITKVTAAASSGRIVPKSISW